MDFRIGPDLHIEHISNVIVYLQVVSGCSQIAL